MDWIMLFLAIALPTLLGVAVVMLITPRPREKLTLLTGGYGILLGLLLTPLLMRILDSIQAPLTFQTISLALVSVTLTLFALGRRAPTAAGGVAGHHDQSITLTPVQKCLVLLCLGLLIMRLVTLGCEVIWRPLYPWDATMHWATKARVWFDAGSLVPFVENQEWLSRGGEGIFTDHHPEYPPTIPLLQMWISLALGRWDESLINIPWLMCALALACMFLSQARQAGANFVVGLVFTYLTLSMPLLNTHVALAGYADLFLGTTYGGALMAFHNGIRNKHRWQLLLAACLAILCTQIKNEGFYWALTFIPATVAIMLPRRVFLGLSVLAVGLLILLLVFFPRDLVIAGHSMANLELHYRPDALPALFKQLLLYGNWHLFGYLLLLLPPLWLLKARSCWHKHIGVTVALACAISLYFVLFLFTRYAYGAINFTASARIALHLVPGLMFLLMLFYQDLAARFTRR